MRGGGGGEQPAQFRLPFGGVALLAEHDVEAVAEGVPGAGQGVVRGERGGVQGAGTNGLGAGGFEAVARREILEQRLHHVPGRHFASVDAGLHALRIALPEHPAPAAALVKARQQTVQVVRELPHLSRELFHSHRPTPARPEHSGP
ncbi:hypothetical protein [Streptomyces sp. CC219B]|uniref:hypothetical protein n=1 Tax=Streptomyces sp. CC219B TaxID=3044574 RepID=UPI0032C190C2